MNVLKNVLKSFLKKRRSRSMLLLASVFVMLLPLFMSSCGDYDTAPERDPKINVLISAATLNDWVDPDKGYPGDQYGHNRVVVLHVGAGYSSGHVPGAYSVGSDDLKDFSTGFTRSDGVSNIDSVVAIQSSIDKLIKKAGIDGGSIIVLTSNNSDADFKLLSRVYFNFRYWGFSRSKLRVLDGFVNTTWVNSNYALDYADPKATESAEYAVCNLTQEPDRFRASLEDMIKVAEDNNSKTVIIDTRSAAEYNGTIGLTVPGTNGAVAFEGHIKGALWQEYTGLLKANGTLLDKEPIDELTPIFSALDIPVDSSTTAYVYGKNGESAAITFLALDGVLNYPVRLYDGGWLEWGQMAEKPNGDLDDSKWATDVSTRSGAVTYNTTVDTLSTYSFVDSYATNANAVNEEDRVICFAGGGGDAGGY